MDGFENVNEPVIPEHYRDKIVCLPKVNEILNGIVKPGVNTHIADFFFTYQKLEKSMMSAA